MQMKDALKEEDVPEVNELEFQDIQVPEVADAFLE